jgi:hypothetical protein
MKKRYMSLIAGACFILTSGAIQAATATFDSFSEGAIGNTFTDGGITFSDYDNYISYYTPPLYIDDATATLGNSTFSPNNVLSFTSLISGGTAGYGRFGSITMSIDSVATSASLDIFAASFPKNNQLTLNAYYQGSFVDSVSVWLSAFGHFTRPGATVASHQYTMTIDGIQFDELQLVSSGSYDSGASFILLDNVVFDTPAPVPVPAAVWLFGSGLLGLASFSRKKKVEA